MYVYTMLYSDQKNFLMFTKPQKGYFFKNKNNHDGKVVKKGQYLNGGGFHAFPGGTAETDDIADQGRKEFIEECGRLISFEDDGQLSLIKKKVEDGVVVQDDDVDVHIEKSFVRTLKKGKYGYSALYIQLSDDDLRIVGDYLSRLSIPDGSRAVDDILDGTILKYAQIGELFPYAPWDNELETVTLWNYVEDWSKIKLLDNAQNKTDWFYAIIVSLFNGEVSG